MASSKRRMEDSPGVPERSSGERSEPVRSGGTPGDGAGGPAPSPAPVPLDPEVLEKAQRRQYSAEYKLRVLREADATEPGQTGALLRREGLYSFPSANVAAPAGGGCAVSPQPQEAGPQAEGAEPSCPARGGA
jgi:hypothetical protein